MVMSLALEVANNSSWSLCVEDRMCTICRIPALFASNVNFHSTHSGPSLFSLFFQIYAGFLPTICVTIYTINLCLRFLWEWLFSSRFLEVLNGFKILINLEKHIVVNALRKLQLSCLCVLFCNFISIILNLGFKYLDHI